MIVIFFITTEHVTECGADLWVGLQTDRSAGIGPPLRDPEYNPDGSNLDCDSPDAYTHALQAIGPHTAPLGIKFYTGTMFPKVNTTNIRKINTGTWINVY